MALQTAMCSIQKIDLYLSHREKEKKNMRERECAISLKAAGLFTE